MGIFGNKKEGGVLNVIRCDKPSYLVWKWSPEDGVPSRRENAIRYGSSLRVKDGEVAVFIYKQNDGTLQDFIEGPFDKTIQTANFPVLSGLVGSMFGGESPFQAEIYFINLAGNIQIPFFVKPFGVVDPRFEDYAVPVSIKGAMTFNITDYKSFIKLNRMISFSIEDLQEQVKHAVVRYAKSATIKALEQQVVSVLKIEQNIDVVSDVVQTRLKEALFNDFGINLKRLDISDITIDKESDEYTALYEATTELQTELRKASAADKIERMRMGREVEFKAANLQTETNFIDTHRINIQGDVAHTAAESLGNLGGGMAGDGGGGLNPAGMMAGMMLGGAVGSNMANMMNGMMQNTAQPVVPQPGATPPPVPGPAQYHIYANGTQTGPFAHDVVRQMIVSGQVTRDTQLWKPGMSNWQGAGMLPEFGSDFGCVPPPPPAL